ncbi:MAG: hypothetical protein AAF960_21310 [Bacteroidota bacterium]
MKKILVSLLASAVTLLSLSAQTFSDQKTFTFDVRGLETLRLHNKYGSVKVKGIDGNRATLRIKRTIKSSNPDKVEAAKTAVFMDSVNLDGELMFFVENPDHELQIDENGRAFYQGRYQNWSDKRLRFHKLRVDMTIELSVPKSVPLYISTHHDDLVIKGINADVVAQNHHGPVTVEAITGNVDVHTHHGYIKATVTKVPDKDATFDTHHGNIEVIYPSNLAADCSLSTRHGEFYTDFNYTAIPMKAKLVKSHQGTKYKLEGGTSIRVGRGGPKLRFKTYHGSIYLLRK